MRRMLAVAALVLSSAPVLRAQCDTARWMAQIAQRKEDAAMERLFRGITLSADQRARVARIYNTALPHLIAITRSQTDSLPRKLELLDERNAEMLRLLTSDMDRGTFAVNAEDSKRATFILDPACPTGARD
jgi:hypothetical protein